ncbi:MAG: hypothetical protein RLO12_23310, partial [Fulvivirga sp.]
MEPSKKFNGMKWKSIEEKIKELIQNVSSIDYPFVIHASEKFHEFEVSYQFYYNEKGILIYAKQNEFSGWATEYYYIFNEEGLIGYYSHNKFDTVIGLLENKEIILKVGNTQCPEPDFLNHISANLKYKLSSYLDIISSEYNENNLVDKLTYIDEYE